MKLTPIKSNMTEVELPSGTKILFSYKTAVACKHENGHTYRTEKFWSKTTSKHLNLWLDGSGYELVPQSFLDSMATV